MRTILLLILLSFCVTAIKAQAKRDTIPVKTQIDTLNYPLLSINDLRELQERLLNDMPFKYATAIADWVNQKIEYKLRLLFTKPKQ